MGALRPVASAATALLVFAPLGMLAFLPLVFVATGLTALGARAGLWSGEPTVNDGEEYWAWPLGLCLLAGLVALAWLVVTAVAHRAPLVRWLWPAGLTVAAAVVLLVGTGVVPLFGPFA